MARLQSPFGSRNRDYVTASFYFPIATTAVDGWLWLHPGNNMIYELVSVQEKHMTAGGASATLALRKVTAEATDPDDTAGATVLELLTDTTLDLTSTEDTLVSADLVSTAGVCKFSDGDALGANFGGTITPLAGMALTLTFLVKPF